MVPESRACAVPRPVTLRATHLASDGKQLSAWMAATLSSELDGRVPIELVAEIIRTVLDESRQSAREEAAESAMTEARKRLERFIRARLPR